MNTRKNKTIWTKMSGAGNRFWIAYFPPTAVPPSQKEGEKLAQAFCQSRQSVFNQKKGSADGLVILQPSKTADFKWLFYNADGSLAEMCGNAACCVTDYVFKKNLLPSNISSFWLKTKAGKIKGERVNQSARILLKQSQDIQGPFEALFHNQKIPYWFINSSTPHAVIKVSKDLKVLKCENSSRQDQTGKTSKGKTHLYPFWLNTNKKREEQKTKLAKLLRNSTTHHKNGINVSFYELKKSEGGRDSLNSTAWLFAHSFERGVEDFTPACGTGALAVAQVYRKFFLNLNCVFVEMPGGVLKIEFHSDNKISLTSPIQWIEEKKV